MKRHLAIVCLAVGTAVTLAAPADAQRPEPRIFVSVFGGVAGSGNLWSVSRQPLAVLGAPSVFDTLAVSRRLSTGITAGITVAYFRTPHFGLSLEGTYLGLGVDDDCQPFTGTSTANAEVCNDIQARGARSTTAVFSAGPTVRIAPRSVVSPYARVNVGLSVRSASVIEMAGRFATGGGIAERVLIEDDNTTTINPTFLGAVGVAVPISPGYQFRMEFRDHLLRLQRVTGPADAFAMAPTEGFFKHTLALVVGLDIILEQRRGRRY